jgi:NAD dependent epimerase/dehydratase family enzyme
MRRAAVEGVAAYLPTRTRTSATSPTPPFGSRFTQSGGTGIVLRFGWFYGPGAAHSEQMLAQARHHIGFVLGPPDGYVSSIHVADAAAAVAAAL